MSSRDQCSDCFSHLSSEQGHALTWTAATVCSCRDRGPMVGVPHKTTDHKARRKWSLCWTQDYIFWGKKPLIRKDKDRGIFFLILFFLFFFLHCFWNMGIFCYSFFFPLFIFFFFPLFCCLLYMLFFFALFCYFYLILLISFLFLNRTIYLTFLTLFS